MPLCTAQADGLSVWCKWCTPAQAGGTGSIPVKIDMTLASIARKTFGAA